MPELIAEFTNALYKIDRYDSPIITRAQFANLVFINKQTTEMIGPKGSIPETKYGSMLTGTLWASGDIENIGQDLEYIEGVREVMPEVTPNKAMQINMMRFAARVWLDRFSEQEREAAKFGAAVIFGNLFKQSYGDILNPDMHGLNPEVAFLSKQEALEDISNYCFAGVPMSRKEAHDFAVMSRDII
jgi:hypothetical protein